MDNDLNLLELCSIVLKRKWIVIYSVLFFVMVFCLYSFFFAVPVYNASVSIIIGKEAAALFYEDKYTDSDILMYQQLVKTYTEIAQSERVYQMASEAIKDEDFKKIISLKVESTPQTQILKITVEHPSSENIAAYANEIANCFITVAGEVLPASELKVLDDAKKPVSPIAPIHIQHIALGTIIGLAVSAGIIFLLEYSDQTIRTEQDVKRYLDVPVLAVVEK